MSTSAVLVANGEKPVSNYAKQLIEQNNLRICVDSNLSFFKELDVEPDIIIGDLDTIEINAVSPKSIIVKEDDQNIFSADDQEAWPSGPFGKKDDYADEAGSSYKRAKDWSIDKPGEDEATKGTGYKA